MQFCACEIVPFMVIAIPYLWQNSESMGGFYVDPNF